MSIDDWIMCAILSGFVAVFLFCWLCAGGPRRLAARLRQVTQRVRWPVVGAAASLGGAVAWLVVIAFVPYLALLAGLVLFMMGARFSGYVAAAATKAAPPQIQAPPPVDTRRSLDAWKAEAAVVRGYVPGKWR